MEAVLTAEEINWKSKTLDPKQDIFSSNDVMDAYFKGKNEGLDFSKKILLNQLSENIDNTISHTSQVVNKLKELSLNPINAYLRIHSIQHFEVLVTLPEIDILGENILSFYKYLGGFEKSVETDLYTINYTICSYNDSFNEQLLALDGYFFKSK